MSTIIRHTSFRNPMSTSGPNSMNHILHGSQASAEHYQPALPSSYASQLSPGYTPPDFLLPGHVPLAHRQGVPSRQIGTPSPMVTLRPIRAGLWPQHGLPVPNRQGGHSRSRLASRLERAWAGRLHHREDIDDHQCENAGAQHPRRTEDILRRNHDGINNLQRGLADIDARTDNLQDQMGLGPTRNDRDIAWWPLQRHASLDVSVSARFVSCAVDTVNQASPVYLPGSPMNLGPPHVGRRRSPSSEYMLKRSSSPEYTLPSTPRHRSLPSPEDTPGASRNKRRSMRTDHY